MFEQIDFKLKIIQGDLDRLADTEAMSLNLCQRLKVAVFNIACVRADIERASESEVEQRADNKRHAAGAEAKPCPHCNNGVVRSTFGEPDTRCSICDGSGTASA